MRFVLRNRLWTVCPYNPLLHIFCMTVLLSVRLPHILHLFDLFISVLWRNRMCSYIQKTHTHTQIGIYMNLHIKSQTARHMDINIFNLYNFILSVTSHLVIWTNIARWLLYRQRTSAVIIVSWIWMWTFLRFSLCNLFICFDILQY